MFLICPSATVLGQALIVFHPDSSVDLLTGISALDAFKQSISPEAGKDISPEDSQSRQSPLDLTLTQNPWPTAPLPNALVPHSVMKCLPSDFRSHNGPTPEICQLFKMFG